MVHFVGAGPGAPDLITVRGQRLLAEADVIIYAGSLVNPALLEGRKAGCRVYDSAGMTLEEVAEAMRRAEREGLSVVRLHTGDPCVYGAVREQMDLLEKDGIPYDSTPGVSSFCGAAAALDLEYTLPGISQSVILTRMAGRTPVPERESIESFAAHGASMVVFLSAGRIEELAGRLLAGGYRPDTPAAIVYKATWPEEEKYICTVGTLARTAAARHITKTALILVGDAVSRTGYERSKLYDPSFSTGFREARVPSLILSPSPISPPSPALPPSLASQPSPALQPSPASPPLAEASGVPLSAPAPGSAGAPVPLASDHVRMPEISAGSADVPGDGRKTGSAGAFSQSELRALIRRIRGADPCAGRAAAARADSLAAPPGSLGKLTEAAVRLAGITGKVQNRVDRRRIIVMCADNGVVEEGVSSAPQAVTRLQAVNMTRHLTGMSSMAAHFGCQVEVVDVGIAGPCREELSDGKGILPRRIRRGTGNIAREPAMTRREALAAIGVGIERARQAAGDGIEVIGVGEMGIGNTTTSSAVLAALTGLPVEAVTGRGGGLTEEAFAGKKRVIERALRLHGFLPDGRAPESGGNPCGQNAESSGNPCSQAPGSSGNPCGQNPENSGNPCGQAPESSGNPCGQNAENTGKACEQTTECRESPCGRPDRDPVEVLARVGGLDLAAMCGVFLGAALYRIPVVVDGFISIVAALCAQRLCGACRDFMFPSHVSEETGFMRAAEELGLDPWLHLHMRLGEGSGCPLAFQVLEAACVLMNEMATFQEAEIDDGYLADLRAMAPQGRS